MPPVLLLLLLLLLLLRLFDVPKPTACSRREAKRTTTPLWREHREGKDRRRTRCGHQLAPITVSQLTAKRRCVRAARSFYFIEQGSERARCQAKGRSIIVAHLHAAGSVGAADDTCNAVSDAAGRARSLRCLGREGLRGQVNRQHGDGAAARGKPRRARTCHLDSAEE